MLSGNTFAAYTPDKCAPKTHKKTKNQFHFRRQLMTISKSIENQ